MTTLTDAINKLPTVLNVARGAAPHARPKVRRNVAYLLQVFPKYSETFIVNELIEHQRQGSPVRVISLRYPREGRFHACVAQLENAAEYVPESLSEHPRKVLDALRGVLWNSPGAFGRCVREWLARRVTFRDLWQAALVRRWAERRKVDHVHSHFGGFAAAVAYLSRLMGGPTYSVTIHAHEIFRESADHELLRRIIANSAFTVTVSRFNAEHLRTNIGAAPNKVRVLYNGIPLERFPYSPGPREPGTILAVGRLIEKKGFVHLIRACRTLADRGLLRRCEIVGEGREHDALKAEIKRLGLSDVVKLVGAWPQERVAAALSSAAAFALPCVAAQDGNMDALPTVLLEAMAAGCPVASTRLSGIPEIVVDGESGLLVEPGDDAALAQAIAALLCDTQRSQQMAEVGRRRVEAVFNVAGSVETLAGWLHAAADGADGLIAPTRRSHETESTPAGTTSCPAQA